MSVDPYNLDNLVPKVTSATPAGHVSGTSYEVRGLLGKYATINMSICHIWAVCDLAETDMMSAPADNRIRSQGVAILAIAIGMAASPTAAQGRGAPQQAAGNPPSAHRALLNRFCVGCHSDRLRTADLSLEGIDVEAVAGDAPLWERVVRKLRTRSMPPLERPRPEEADYDGFVAYLEAALDGQAASHPAPGRTAALHRLNRAEYANAIRDLLGIELDERATLPADDTGYGFDNIADLLAVSPGLLERYMTAARRVSRAAVGDPAIRPSVSTYRQPPTFVQDVRLEGLPFGSRGGIVIDHEFPLDGEYTFKVRLQRTWRDEIRGLLNRNQLDVRLDGRRVSSFVVGGGGDLTEWLPGIAVPTPSEYEQTADAGLEVTLPVTAGRHRVGVAFAAQAAIAEVLPGPVLSAAGFEFSGDRYAPMGVDAVDIVGPAPGGTPGDTISRQRIFVCYPATPDEEAPCAREILTGLARRAFRRAPTEQDVRTLNGLYREGRADGGFEAGIRAALRGLLVDPDFLFRIERDPVDAQRGDVYQISDHGLASRLSFFLWSSIPDDELLGLAEQGRLSEPDVLEQQVTRMLRDDRAMALVDNFTGQWLYLRNLRAVAPDPKTFPAFDHQLRTSLQRETGLFIGSLLRDDRSVLDLLRANHTYLDERLARFYGVPGVYGSHFRRVELNDPARVGLLGHASVLTVTSYPTRTSPVLRGKWVLENLLGAPPPPPPPNVPDLPDAAEDGARASVRERMEAHRANPVCASCHKIMDPLGFALENFDAVGRWRTVDAASAAVIDSSGTMPDGTRFDGVAELRTALLEDPWRSEFIGTLTEKLLTYALGRGVESYDMPAIRKIVREAAANDYRWSDILLGIAKSVPFQMREVDAS